MKRTWLVLLGLLLSATLAAQAQFSYATNADGITVTITSYSGAGGAVIIPSTNTSGLPVTSIGQGAFYQCTSMTSVTIPGNVSNIGQDAFARCTGLTNAILSNGVTIIGDAAFLACTSLTSVTIPDSVTSIGDVAFYYSGLTSIMYHS